jgi:hypothetical protein
MYSVDLSIVVVIAQSISFIPSMGVYQWSSKLSITPYELKFSIFLLKNKGFPDES